jgi:hypothetical protein
MRGVYIAAWHRSERKSILPLEGRREAIGSAPNKGAYASGSVSVDPVLEKITEVRRLFPTRQDLTQAATL